ncbi:MAG: type II toxin-antitoxin system RelE/ParE family toxin [Tepidiformaceae bacterium]
MWSPQARLEATEVREFISRNNPTAAQAVARRIGAATGRLRQHPNIGRSGSQAGTREVVVTGTPYVIVYRVVKGRVEILRLRHGARLWPEEGRE